MLVDNASTVFTKVMPSVKGCVSCIVPSVHSKTILNVAALAFPVSFGNVRGTFCALRKASCQDTPCC